MKVYALNEIHYLDKKTGKPAIASPADMPDLPQEEAIRLCDAGAARRLTPAEIELDKARAQARARKESGAADEGADEGSAEAAEGAEEGQEGEGDAPATTARTGARRGAGKKASGGDY